MGEYGNGLSASQKFANDKERIKHALNGELVCGETESGFLYKKAAKGECDAYILDAFDDAVYQCLSAYASARALERMLEGVGSGESIDMITYMNIFEQERYRKDDYTYESVLK